MQEKLIKAEGAVVFWQAAEATDLTLLRHGLDCLGLKDFTPDSRPLTQCLFDALRTTVQTPTMLVRPLQVDGFCVVAEHRGDGSQPPVHTPLYSLVILENGALEVHVHDEDIGSFNIERDASMIKAAYDRAQNVLRPSQITAMLVRLLDHMQGIRLRPSGSVYWIPGEAIDTWDQVSKAVKAAQLDGNGTNYIIRTQLDPDTVQAVSDGLMRDVMEVVNDIETELDAGKIGVRALNARVETAQAMRAKIEKYEQLLNENLASLNLVVNKVEAATLSAILIEADKRRKGED